MTSPEEDLLPALRDQVAAPVATGPGTLFGLDDDPDVQWALGFTRGPTEPLGRWGQGILTLLTRGDRAQPLAVHGYASPVVTALAAVAGATFGATTVNWVDHRGSSTGLDGAKRTVRVDTFYLDFDLAVSYQA